MTYEWIKRNDRVKFVYIHSSKRLGSSPAYYICRDNKFHSWIADEGGENWVVRTVAEPDMVIKVPYAAFWMDEISE